MKAERARPEEQGKRFENVLGDAETLLTELSVELNAPKLRQDLAPAPSAMGGGAQGQPGALTKDIVEQLRKQLEQQGGGEKGLNKELVEALEKQVQHGAPGAAPANAPAPAPAPANGKPAAPQGTHP